MLTCSKCSLPLTRDVIVQADGTKLCPLCFERRYARRRRWTLSALLSPLKPLFMLALASAAVYGGYLLYQRQLAAEAAERVLAQKQALADELRTRKEREESEQNRRAAEIQRKLVQAQRDAEKFAQREQDAAERSATRDVREQLRLEEFESAELLRKLQNSAQNAALPEPAQRLNVAPKGVLEALKVKLNSYKRALANAQTQRAEDERKLASYENQYKTYKATADRLFAKYGGNFQPRYITRGNLRTFDTDRQNDYFEYQKSLGEAEKASAPLTILKPEMERRAKETETIKSGLLDIKKELASYGEYIPDLPGSTPASASPATPFDSAPRTVALKTLFKKDGTTIRIQKAMAAGEEWTYTDVDGISGIIPKSLVDRIEKDPE